jgi:hypothetical protein
MPEPTGKQWDISRSGKEFMPDGRVLLTKDEDRRITIYDDNYTELWTGKKTDTPKEYNFLKWPSYSFRSNLSARDFIQAQRLTPEMSRTLEIPVWQNKKISEIWRYLPDDDIFVGYEFKGGKIGYIGSAGFCQKQADCKPFGKFSKLSVYNPQESDNSILLWQTNKRLIAVDFENRKTSVIIDGGEEKLSGIAFKNWSYDGKEPVDANYRAFIKYETKDGSVHLIFNEPNEHLTIKMPRQWNSYLKSSFNAVATKDAVFVFHQTTDILKPAGYDASHKTRDRFYNTYRLSQDVNYSTELYKVDKAGDLNLINKFQWIKPKDIKEKKTISQHYFNYVSALSPAAFFAGNKIIENLPTDVDKIFPAEKSVMMRGYVALIGAFRPQKLNLCVVLSVVMMAIALWHGWSRKNNRFCLALWIIFVGLFNVAGLLTYLALNHTTLIKCPACEKQRNLEKPNCIHCGAGLPLPSTSMVRIK